eukprot:154156-Chlamydomonas_euryale.AAC.1
MGRCVDLGLGHGALWNACDLAAEAWKLLRPEKPVKQYRQQQQQWVAIAASERGAAVCAGRTLMFFARLMISVRRGTPSVTFLADTPAKWNVLS